ncbi:DNA-directed RNA polymerase subunit alpha [Candidatus Roizmanbacteria bacterium]|nr:DNA-directed RNA polymerase subunit alpha [Candidatus Roizmanbacteria bacterium]
MIDTIFSTTVEEQNEQYARLVFEPLAPSFGQSMGNALRRTLLSSLKGAAISYVKIEGANNLFSTIKGVKESVLDIVLNMKQLRFQTPADGSFKVQLNAKGATKLFGKDVNGEATVVNGDVYLGELTDAKSSLSIEAVVETGYGYVASEEKEEKMAGFITIDSSFSPVKKVNYRVEQARVGRKSNFDRLVLEVWTDGSISPIEAIQESSKIIASHFEYMFRNEEAVKETKTIPDATPKADEVNSKLNDIIIDELNLPSRVINALLRENIETVADLVKKGRDKLVVLKGVGRKSIDLIEDELKKMGIELL